MKAWDHLNENEQDSIRLIILPLIEFSYGFEQLQATMLGGAGEASAIMRFYSNALYMYAANFFTIRGDNKLAGALRRLGLEELLEPINKILEIEMGKTTVWRILDTYRDKFLTHNPFSTENILDEIYREVDLTDPENTKKWIFTAWDLFIAIRNLALQLVSMYPQSGIAIISMPDTAKN